MYSQQHLYKAINNFLNGHLSLKNRSSPILVFIWILCLISAKVAAAPCTGTSGDNCLSDCSSSCTTVACQNGTKECKNSTTEEQVLGTDNEEYVPPGPEPICENTNEECKNTTTDAAIPNTETEENISLEQIGECDGELNEFGDCENITTEGDISLAEEEDTTHVSQVVECSEGLYGDNCSLPCPSNCVGPKCDLVTGDCSKGCRIGYQGSQCAEICPPGFYGEECTSNCPSNCATNECHHENGYCLNGCKEDYWGSDCSLVGEFKDNPETTQDNFYQHLSAESKSVLLYMLMSKYEETLEKAQMEVSRSIRLRNKLRVIMGG